MRLILEAGVLVLTLTAMAVTAQAGKLESAAIGTAPEGVGISGSSAPERLIHVPPAGDRSFRTGEIIVSLPSNLPVEAIDALARRHRLTHRESQLIGLLGRTIHRWRIADGRSIPDVIRELERDGGIEAQPNNVFTLQ